MSLCGLSWEKAYGLFITVRPLQLPRQEESTREHSGPFVNTSTHFRQLGGPYIFMLFRNRIFQEAHGCSCVLLFDLVFLWQMKISSGSCKKKTKRKLMPFLPIFLNEVSFTCNPKILWSRGQVNEELLHSLLGLCTKVFLCCCFCRCC